MTTSFRDSFSHRQQPESSQPDASSVPPQTVYEPPSVRSIEDTGLSANFLGDLALKALYLRGKATPADLMDLLKLPYYGVIEHMIRDLSSQEFCFVSRGESMNPLSYVYEMTASGQARAQEVMERNAYVGPAPVNLEAYWEAVSAQTVDHIRVSHTDMAQAFSHMVIDPALFDQLGPAVNSSRSMFLFGEPGNGKTAIAETLVRIQGGAIYIPHAVAIGGEIVKVFDPVHHPAAQQRDDIDPRWVLAKRPVVTVGGELTLGTLDLIYNDNGKYYEAPFQLKANNGAFFIDDFGRQQVSPRDLLNRWIVPLEKRVDFLTLRTGQKIEVPFDTLVIFSTNLDPKSLVDDAFLRRIRYKIEIGNPTADQLKEIFRRVCAAKRIDYNEDAVIYLLEVKYPALGVSPKSVHPRDLVEQIIDYAEYRQQSPVLDRESIEIACNNYFVQL